MSIGPRSKLTQIWNLEGDLKSEPYICTCLFFMNTQPTEMLQPTSVLLSQLDDTQSGTASTVAYYALVVLVMLSPVIILFRLRYPCLALSGLRSFVDMLDDMAQQLIERGETNVMDGVDRLRRQIDDIEHEQSTVIFRWSSVHEYFRSSVIALWKITKCYDEARVLHVSILNAIADQRRAVEDFWDNYRRSQRVGRNHTRDTEVDVDITPIGRTTARL
ncbi:hypothetical protein K435DRAFT_804967 [Dendrothele bispora CBS 962.96]|uniref:Uncharacterized protein n=1 Tax=Dendrothele bispora (strain CBS 962.96) TaxID=1314807 RepID=A0A4S8LD13_DENBC|nr:hypothetical protein K435DRAFT_804967 [Dendrothele bispora CBS 962.96]